MSKRKWILAAAAFALFGGAAGLLDYLRAHQRLGAPGVKVVAQPTYDAEGRVARARSVYLPEEVSGYTSKPMPVTAVELKSLPEDTIFGRRRYRAEDGFEIMASVLLMGSDRTSIHKPQYCLPGQGWRIDRSEPLTIPIERPARYDLPVMKLTATIASALANGEKTEVRGIYVYWFVADRELTADHFERMRWLARDLIFTGTLQRWAYVSCFAVCLPGQEEATFQRTKQFLGAIVPQFQLTNGGTAASMASLPVTPP